MKPTKAMKNAALEGIKLHEEGKSTPGMAPRALDVGRKIAAGQSLSSDHIIDMSHIHASHDVCPKDCEDLLWGGPAGELWAKTNIMKSMGSNLSENEKKLDSLIEDKTNLSFEIFSDINLEEPTDYKEDDEGLIWAPIVRSGMLATRPGPNGEKLDEPLVFVSGRSKDQRKEIGLEDIVDAFNDNAIEHVTLPIDVRVNGENVPAHNNGLYQNTGFIRKLKMADSKKLPGEKVILGGHDFTEPDIKNKVERGTIPSRSCGLLYDYKNTTTGKVYPIALEHTALTSKPWVGGIAAYGSEEFSDRTVVPMMLSEKPFSSEIKNKIVPTKFLQETTTSETKKVRSDQSEFLADIQWGEDPSYNDIRNQISSILQGMTPDFDSYPSYMFLDLTSDKVLIKVNYGIGPDNDAWVCPYTIDENKVQLAPFSDWVDVTKKWVSDTVDPVEDKKKLEMSEEEIKLGTLSSKQRKDLPDSDFIFPSEKRYPIPDLAHARNALARVAQNGSSDEQTKVKNAVYKRYPALKSGSSTKMSESPLKLASARRLGKTGLLNTSPLGGPMSLHMSEEQIERLGLEEGPAKEAFIKQNELLRKQSIELADTRKAEKKTKVEKRISDLKAEGFDAYPGMLKHIESVEMSDDGDIAVELHLSEHGQDIKVPKTITQIIEGFIETIPRKDGKVSLSDVPNLLENPLSKRPDLEVDKGEQKDRSQMTGKELFAEMAAADPMVAKEIEKLTLSSDRKGN